jgi:hypothetical protein
MEYKKPTDTLIIAFANAVNKFVPNKGIRLNIYQEVIDTMIQATKDEETLIDQIKGKA